MEKEPTYAMTEMELRAALMLSATASALITSEVMESKKPVDAKLEATFYRKKIEAEVEKIIEITKNRKRE